MPKYLRGPRPKACLDYLRLLLRLVFSEQQSKTVIRGMEYKPNEISCRRRQLFRRTFFYICCSLFACGVLRRGSAFVNIGGDGVLKQLTATNDLLSRSKQLLSGPHKMEADLPLQAMSEFD